MLKAIAIKAVLGVSAIGLIGGSAALASAPTITASLAAAKTPKAAPNDANAARLHAAGIITKLSPTEMTVERQRRDPKTKAVTKDDVTVALNDKTAVYAFGSKDKHGIDLLKIGQDVRVRFADNNGQKVARGVIILPDRRAGTIVTKDADGKSFTLKTRDGSVVHITTSDKTRFVEGTAKARHAGSWADLNVGDRVLVRGQENSQHVFDAGVVRSARVDKATNPPATAAP